MPFAVVYLGLHTWKHGRYPGILRSRARSSEGALGILPVLDAWVLGKSARANKGGVRVGFNGTRARLVGIPPNGITV